MHRKNLFLHCSILLVTLLTGLIANAQNIFKAIVRDSETKEKLIGATAYIKELKLSNSTDTSGVLILKGIPNGKFEIVFSYIGYEKKETTFLFPLSQQPVEILLKNDNSELAEVIVTSTRTNSRIEDIPIRVEVIGEEEVDEEGSMKPANISMLLAESPGIQAQQTSATNGNVSIRLQGLDGKYTQILKDGFPLFGGFAQGLSIMQIPPLDLKQVEIIKGSSSSLYGSDAVAGIINLITKQPQEKRELTFLVNQTSLLGSDANGYFSQRWKKFGFSLLTANNFQSSIDVNKDGFSDLPKTQTFNLAPTFYYYIDSATTLRFGLNGTLDNRKGGDMLALENQSDTSHKYFESTISSRVSSQLKFDKQFAKGKSLTVKNSVSYFNRDIDQPLSTFKGNQISSYTEAAFNFKIKKHTFVTGINLSTEKFSEDSTKSHRLRSYNYITIGAFLQDDWKLTEKFAVQTGLRTDYQNKFGSFFLPRIAVMYKFNKDFYMRAGSGLGYMVPSIFSTASEEIGINNIQPLSSTIKAEKSIGGNVDFNYKKRIGDEASITFNQSFFVTQINHPLVLDTFSFVNKDKSIITSGFESNAHLRLDELQFFIGYIYVDAQRKYDTIQSFVPLTPKHKINVDIIYEKEDNYSIAFEYYYIASMFRDFDTKTTNYFTMGLIVQKHFKHFSIIANCENLFDVRQTRFENIIIPPTETPTFREIYAPLDGRVFNIAVRIKL
jgi:iron complex outermembrane receptor protein